MSGLYLPSGTAAAFERRATPTEEKPVPADPVEWAAQHGVYLWSKQREIARSVEENKRTYVPSCHAAGKGLALDTRLPTPDGWTTMGEVRPGDRLLDEQGKPATVTLCSEIHHRQCYRVTFDDGSSLVTDDQHRWSATRFRVRGTERARGKVADWRQRWDLSEVVTTPELAESLMTTWNQRNWAVPNAKPLALPDADLPIDPYVLGAWLGDGTTVHAAITCCDQGIVDEVERRGWRMVMRPSTAHKAPVYGLRAPAGGLKAMPLLREVGVLGFKHIPSAYLRAGMAQRLDLLRGLMDTDGFASRGPAVGIDLCDERLAMDVLELIRSLGWKANARPGRSASGGTRWRMSFRPDMEVFNLVRKRRSRPEGFACKSTQRMVVSVEPVQTVPTRCVMVDSPSSLYLAGEAFIPTHNTFLAATIAAKWIAGAPPGQRMLVTSAPSERQVTGLLWNELAKAHDRYGLPGTIAGAEWHIGPSGSRIKVGFGAKPQDLSNLEQAMTRFQGYHAPEGVLFILDEASGIPPWLWTAGDAITTGDQDRVLAIGNPDDPSSEFAKRCDAATGSTRAPGKRYEVAKGGRVLAQVIPIDAYATPNLSGEHVPDHVRRSLISRSTVEDWREMWGEDNPLFVAKVRGLFPDRSSDNVIGPALIRAAWALDFPGLGLGCFGLDVARSVHGDESAFYRSRGGQVRLVDGWREPDSTNLVAKVLRSTTHVPGVPIAVDTDGVGGPVHDMIRMGLPHLGLEGRPTIPVSARAGRPINKRDFDTRGSELWWEMRTALTDGLVDLDEDDSTLMGQLMAPKWYLKAGRIHVESKDELAKRGISSPDRADATILAFMGERHAGVRRQLLGDRKAIGQDVPSSLSAGVMDMPV